MSVMNHLIFSSKCQVFPSPLLSFWYNQPSFKKGVLLIYMFAQHSGTPILIGASAVRRKDNPMDAFEF